MNYLRLDDAEQTNDELRARLERGVRARERGEVAKTLRENREKCGIEIDCFAEVGIMKYRPVRFESKVTEKYKAPNLMIMDQYGDRVKSRKCLSSI